MSEEVAREMAIGVRDRFGAGDGVPEDGPEKRLNHVKRSEESGPDQRGADRKDVERVSGVPQKCKIVLQVQVAVRNQ